TGEGQRVHVPMYETFVAFIMNEHMQGRMFEPPQGPAGYQRMLTPHRRPYPTAGGYICVLPYIDKHWRAFFELAGRPELSSDARFADQPSRSKNIEALYEIVGGIMQGRTSAQWLEVLAAADIPAMAMHTPEDLFECPHLDAVGMFPLVDHPTEGKVRHLKVPVHFSKTPGGYYRHAEQIGQSTDAVMAEIGYSPEEFAALRATGVTGRPKAKIEP
ncbi:MAG: CoA transferase, partial [Alphaproteobacteria bacterium]